MGLNVGRGGAWSEVSQVEVRGGGKQGGGAAPGLEMGIYLIGIDDFGENHRHQHPSLLPPCQPTVEGKIEGAC